MLTDLPRVAASMAGVGPLVVFHSWVAAYLSEEEQRSLTRTSGRTRRAATRPSPLLREPLRDTGPAHPAVTGAAEGPDLATTLVHVGPGGRPAVRLADTHPHGYWIRWWPQP